MNNAVKLVLLIAGLSCTCFGSAQEDTQVILVRALSRGIEILQKQDWDDRKKIAEFEQVLGDACHLRMMALLTLDKEVRKSLTPEQSEAFVKAFTDVIIESYYGKIRQLDSTDYTIEYTGNEEVGTSRRKLTALMKAGGKGIEVVYLFGHLQGQWGIYDLQVEDVSLVASYKAQFRDYLATHSTEELLAELTREENRFLAGEKDESTVERK